MRKPDDIKVPGWDQSEPPGSQPSDDPAKMSQAVTHKVLGPLVLHHDHSASAQTTAQMAFPRFLQTRVGWPDRVKDCEPSFEAPGLGARERRNGPGESI